jgi:hypothetical protein
MPIYEFELLSAISAIETIAIGSNIRILDRLRQRYGGDRWRKLKGRALVRLYTGEVFEAEVHYYECHGIGKRALMIKLPEDEDENE